jgi:hypothetical protein
MTRTHFLFPVEPVMAWGSSIIAPCGTEVRNAVPKLLMEADAEWFNSATIFVPSSLRGDCWRCAEKYNEKRKETTETLYLYALQDGEEALHPGGEKVKAKNAQAESAA